MESSSILTVQEPSFMHMNHEGEGRQAEGDKLDQEADNSAHADAENDGPAGEDSTFLEPTQKLSEVKDLALFPD